MCVHVLKYTCVYIPRYISWLSFLRASGHTNIQSHRVYQVSRSWCLNTMKQGFSKKLLNPGWGIKYKMNLENLVTPESKDVFKEWQGCFGSQLDGASHSLNWDNLITKWIMIVVHYFSLNKIGTHSDINKWVNKWIGRREAFPYNRTLTYKCRGMAELEITIWQSLKNNSEKK